MESWSDQSLYYHRLPFFFIIGLPTIFALFFVQFPYGKYCGPSPGPYISSSLAWFLFESPAVFLVLIIYSFGQHASNIRSLSLLSVFLLHYVHRTCIYPLRLRKTTSVFPVKMALFSFSLCTMNSYLQARWVSHYGNYEKDGWFWWRFFGGFIVFLTGMIMNVKSDLVLVELKAQGGGAYKIPRGGSFELVSCANYFWEIVEWMAWAVMTWSWAGLGFFFFTCANLVPRAPATHIWYLEKFGEDYPKNRKAVFPFLY